MGFESLDGSGKARVVIEQVTDRNFKLLEGFRYVDKDGVVHPLRPQDLPCTDLASVPRAFQWFVGSHGRHTLAALMHDFQTVRRPNESRSDYGYRRTVADDRFLEMMRDLGVPRVRRNLMWGAVHAATRLLYHVRLAQLTIALWGVSAIYGTWTLYVAVRDQDPRLAGIALLAPLIGALLWAVPSRRPLRRWRCGVIVGYGVLIFVPAMIVNGISLLVHALLGLIAGGQGPSPWPNPDDCG